MDASELLRQYAVGKRDFSGVNLSGENLCGVELCGVDLSGAKLLKTNLTSAP